MTSAQATPDDVDPIKINWTGDARTKFKTRSVRARVDDGVESGELTMATLDRLKTRVVVETEREAEALEVMLENQARAKYTWTTEAHTKAYWRVLDELRNGMRARDWGDHGGDARSDFDDKHDLIDAIDEVVVDHDAAEIATDDGTLTVEHTIDVMPARMGEPDGVIVDGEHVATDDVDEVRPATDDDRDDQGDQADQHADNQGGDVFVLLACSKTKNDGELPAREKYDGALFKKSKQYAETIDAPYAILSGKYGVLEADDVIDDYDVSVYDRDSDEWGDEVRSGLDEIALEQYNELRIFAGKAYREPIEKYLDDLDVDVTVPLDGASGIGPMLADMNDLLDGLDDGDRDDEQGVEIDERVDTLKSVGLSGREAQVVARKEQGLTHEEIADEIEPSESSVDEYSRRAGKKIEKACALVNATDVFDE
jgi:predicted transcriptional regulator